MQQEIHLEILSSRCVFKEGTQLIALFSLVSLPDCNMNDYTSGYLDTLLDTSSLSFHYFIVSCLFEKKEKERDNFLFVQSTFFLFNREIKRRPRGKCWRKKTDVRKERSKWQNDAWMTVLFWGMTSFLLFSTLSYVRISLLQEGQRKDKEARSTMTSLELEPHTSFDTVRNF